MRIKLLLPATAILLAACAKGGARPGSTQPTIVLQDTTVGTVDSVGPVPGPCSLLVVNVVSGMTVAELKVAFVTALQHCKG